MEWTIQNVQVALKKEGIYKGDAHGKLDDKTKAAIKAFKKANKLKDDFKIDQPLITALSKKKELGYYKDLAFYDDSDRDDIELPKGLN